MSRADAFGARCDEGEGEELAETVRQVGVVEPQRRRLSLCCKPLKVLVLRSPASHRPRALRVLGVSRVSCRSDRSNQLTLILMLERVGRSKQGCMV